jgi:predicted ATPase/DNA-binding winged helix-turn-helix (wHTH) protein
MSQILRLSTGTVDLSRQRFEGEGPHVALTTREAELLAYLAARAGQDVSRDELLQEVWGYAPGVVTRTIDVTVRRLRQKLERDPARPDHVLTVHGVGYRFVPADEETVIKVDPQPLRPRVDEVVGRARFLTDLERWADEGLDLVTVVGAGGVGKSALVASWLGRTASRWTGGIVYCDLTDAHDQAEIEALLGEALGLQGAQASSQVSEALGGLRTALVYLDNVEHVVQVLAPMVQAWRSAAPGVVFVITSREALRLRREQVLPVPPLTVPRVGATGGPATELFLRRAREVEPDFAGDLETIAEIVRRLDGLPLAIELAAARVRVMSTSEILEHLEHRFELLKASGYKGGDHRGTLRSTLDWSWSSLAEWERAALVQCSAFRGGFTLAAANRVLDLTAWPDAPWALDAVQSLFDRSLIGSVPGLRVRRCRLYESIRIYAEQKLVTPGQVEFPDGSSYTGPQAREALWERHGAWAASLGLGAAFTERGNLLAAVERARNRGDDPMATSCDRVLQG